jgi:outer membrane immunogenic protein
MRIFTAAVALALMSGSAMAADLTYEAPVAAPAPVFTWTGFVAGVNAGYGWGDADYDFNTQGWFNPNPGDSFSHDIDGAFLGGHVGYNYQINNVVLGLEGALFWSDIGKSDVISPYFPDSDRFETKIDWFGTITPRIGYAFDRAQIFAKGGLAFGKVKSTVSDMDSGDVVSGDSTRAGWTVGAGVEYAFTDNILLGLEYNYTDLGKVDVFSDIVDGDTNHNVDTAFSAVSLTLGYKF